MRASRRSGYSEQTLRKAKLEALQRWAKWLGVKTKPGKNSREELTFLIHGILRAVKRLENYPRGTVPKDIKQND